MHVIFKSAVLSCVCVIRWVSFLKYCLHALFRAHQSNFSMFPLYFTYHSLLATYLCLLHSPLGLWKNSSRVITHYEHDNVGPESDCISLIHVLFSIWTIFSTCSMNMSLLRVQPQRKVWKPKFVNRYLFIITISLITALLSLKIRTNVQVSFEKQAEKGV